MADCGVSKRGRREEVEEEYQRVDGVYVLDKELEKQVAAMVKGLEVETSLSVELPMVARLDGVAFHTFTKGLAKPYDVRFIYAMQQVAMDMVKHFHSVAAFCVSDEITLVFPPQPPPNTPLYNYRVQKVSSVLAGFASVRFHMHISEAFRRWPEPTVEPHVRARMDAGMASFDARIFSAPTLVAATQAVLWRHRYDGPKNAISTCARHVFGHKSLHSVGCKRMLQMLEEAGKPFSSEHPAFRFGTLVKKANVTKDATEYKTGANIKVTRTMIVSASGPMHGSYEEETALIFAERIDLAPGGIGIGVGEGLLWRLQDGQPAEPEMTES